MQLSCFDGGHVFLFKAVLGEDDTLSGDFWSRDSWHETWTARRDEHAASVDALDQTHPSSEDRHFTFDFPDLDGNRVDQDHADLAGKVRLVTIFGSWCPNCNDEAPFLEELYQTYRDKGLEVVGLAFEMTEDEDRNRRVLKRFKQRHKLSYKILLAGGTKDKQKAAQILGNLDHVLAFPTTLLLDREGKVVSIHTGFTGPGTGDHYQRLVDGYHRRIAEIL